MHETNVTTSILRINTRRAKKGDKTRHLQGLNKYQ